MNVLARKKLTKEQRTYLAERLWKYRAKERLQETDEEQELRMAQYKEDNENYGDNSDYRRHYLSDEEHYNNSFHSDFKAWCREEDSFSDHS